MDRSNLLPSFKSGNMNSFHGQSENSLSKSSNISHPKSSSKVENQENLDPNISNKRNNTQSNSKQRSTAETSNKTKKTKQEEEEKTSVPQKKLSFNTIEDIMKSLRMEGDRSSEILYQEGDEKETAKIQTGKVLRDSFFSEFEKGITEYRGEEDTRKIFPRLDPKNYELVEILGGGYHGIACKLREKDNNEIVVKLYLKDRRDEFFHEACVLSECRKSGVLYMNKYKDGIPTCFEMENYYGLTLQAGFATLRGLKRYLKETGKKLTEDQLSQLVSQINKEYLKLKSANYVHRDIKPENIILLPSFEIRIIDFGFARKYPINMTEMIKGKVGTRVYLSPNLLQKGPDDLISIKEAISGDWYALGLSILEIAVPDLNPKDVNKPKAIQTALKKLKSRFKNLSPRIRRFLNYEDLNDDCKGGEWENKIETGDLKELLEEFKSYLEEKNHQRKNVLGMQEIHLEEDEEEISTLFEESQGHFTKGREAPYQEFEGEEKGQIGLCSYFQMTNFELNRETVHALVDKLSREGCIYCQGLKKTWEVPFMEGKKGLDEFHEKEIEKFKKEEIEGTFGFWGHLNNVMILKEYLGLENEGKIGFEDKMIDYLREVFQIALEKGFLSGRKYEILNNFAYYHQKSKYYKTDHLQGPVKKILYVDDSQDFYMNMFLNICNTKALRVIRMLTKENNLKFLEKLQRFAGVYCDLMLKWLRDQFEKKLDIFVMLLRFLKLFSEELEPSKLKGLLYLQNEARVFNKRLKALYKAFDLREYDKCIQILFQYELFYVMIGSYLIYWAAGGRENYKTDYDQSELLTEHIHLLMPSYTNTIRVASPTCLAETHPLEKLLGEQEFFKMPKRDKRFVFRDCFEVKLDQETQEFTGTLYSLEIRQLRIEDFYLLIEENLNLLNTLKVMSLNLESNYREDPIEKMPFELNLELLKINIESRGISFPEFEALVDFVRMQRSVRAFYMSFQAENTTDEQVQCLAEGLGNLQSLNKVKLDFINCHFVEEDSLRVLVDKLKKIKSLEFLEIFAGGCPKMTRVLKFGEHFRMKVDPVPLNPDVYVNDFMAMVEQD